MRAVLLFRLYCSQLVPVLNSEGIKPNLGITQRHVDSARFRPPPGANPYMTKLEGLKK